MLTDSFFLYTTGISRKDAPVFLFKLAEERPKKKPDAIKVESRIYSIRNIDDSLPENSSDAGPTKRGGKGV